MESSVYGGSTRELVFGEWVAVRNLVPEVLVRGDKGHAETWRGGSEQRDGETSHQEGDLD